MNDIILWCGKNKKNWLKNKWRCLELVSEGWVWVNSVQHFPSWAHLLMNINHRCDTECNNCFLGLLFFHCICSFMGISKCIGTDKVDEHSRKMNQCLLLKWGLLGHTKCLQKQWHNIFMILYLNFELHDYHTLHIDFRWSVF